MKVNNQAGLELGALTNKKAFAAITSFKSVTGLFYYQNSQPRQLQYHQQELASIKEDLCNP